MFGSTLQMQKFMFILIVFGWSGPHLTLDQLVLLDQRVLAKVQVKVQLEQLDLLVQLATRDLLAQRVRQAQLVLQVRQVRQVILVQLVQLETQAILGLQFYGTLLALTMVVHHTQLVM
jgi:hypothetical protein